MLEKIFFMKPIDIFSDLVKISSSSHDHIGIDKLSGHIESLFPDKYFVKNYFTKTNSPKALYIESKLIVDDKSKLLISGHLDTVFPLSESPFKIENECIYGSGSNDMKGGLAAAISAILQSLNERNNISNIGFFLNPDEELGTNLYRDELKQIASKYDYAIVLEGAGDEGELCDSRRGIVTFEIDFVGKEGHSGHFTGIYPNAIKTTSEYIEFISQLQDRENGITINFGQISGGVAQNVVAGHCKLIGEVRFKNKTQLDLFKEKTSFFFSTIEFKPLVVIGEGFPAMEVNLKSQKLKKIISDAFEKNNLSIPIFHHRNSASDANFLSEIGLGVIDGFGTIGWGVHTKKEKSLISSLDIAIRRISALIECFQ